MWINDNKLLKEKLIDKLTKKGEGFILFFIYKQKNVVYFVLQVRMLRGDDMWVHDKNSPYKTVEELWDGDI
jgi:hypothetical protein